MKLSTSDLVYQGWWAWRW